MSEGTQFRGDNLHYDTDTFAYLIHEHIRNINMRRHITSALGHELSGVFAHKLIIVMPGLNVRGLQSKLTTGS